MFFNVSGLLLDALVLSVVNRNDTYGYEITQSIRKAVEVSESTLYPVLRRLQKEMCLETYDMEYQGRNRRYYKITSKGKSQLSLYLEEWKIYKKNIDNVFSGGIKDE
ncbi:MAG: PadR family transcriptional regulator [Clostridia bacterium]|jgi:PadR family transcriptional regulator PadR|nr:PadR family transcriptional regulator [Clostridia bacterium]